ALRSMQGVDVIDAATNTVARRITLGIKGGSAGIVFMPSGNKAYLTDGSARAVVIDVSTDQVLSAISLPDAGHGLSLTSDASTLVVAHPELSNNLTLVDTSTDTVVTTISVGRNPAALGTAIEPPVAGVNNAYVTNMGAATVSIVNTATNAVTGTIAVG